MVMGLYMPLDAWKINSLLLFTFRKKLLMKERESLTAIK